MRSGYVVFLKGVEMSSNTIVQLNEFKKQIAIDSNESSAYPYEDRIDRNSYEARKKELQIELLKLQAWVKETQQKVVIVFEGRDAAGKGGTIKRLMEHLNPRGARVVALLKPTETERGQWYFQRYVAQLPTAGLPLCSKRPSLNGCWSAAAFI
jgi:polyphosphate kinase 2 (PPK2 family)